MRLAVGFKAPESTSTPAPLQTDRPLLLLLTRILPWLFLALALAAALLRPLSEPDEGRYGEAAREMVASGDWLLPRHAERVYPDKPPGAYWIMGGALLLGDGALPIRVPALLGLALTVVLVAREGRRRGGAERGAVAALLVASCPLLLVLGQLATLDALLTACITAAILAADAWRREGRAGLAVAAGVALGFGFLVKGPVAWILPLLVLGAGWGLAHGPRQALRVFHPTLWVTAAAVGLPWYGLAARVEPELLEFWIGRETVGRLASDVHERGQPFYFFPALAAIAFLPWLLAALAPRFRPRPEDRLALVWALLPVVFFSIPSGKQPGYLAPAVPGFALWLSSGFAAADARAVRHALAALLLAALGAAFWLHLDPQLARSDDPFVAELQERDAAAWPGAQLFGWSYGAVYRLARTDLACFGPLPKAWSYERERGRVEREGGRRRALQDALAHLGSDEPVFLIVHEPDDDGRNLAALRAEAAAAGTTLHVWMERADKSLVANTP